MIKVDQERNMEGIILGKLKKTISKSLLMRPKDLFFQTKAEKDQTFFQDLIVPQKIELDVKEERPSANIQETIPDSTSNHTGIIIDKAKLKKGDEEEQERQDLLLLPESKEIVVLYTTSLRGIRKTYEDCNAVRFILQSFHVAFRERDVSMHLEYREELWKILGGSSSSKNRVVPPRLFIRGKYIGGAEEVVGLHESGMLLGLLDGVLRLSPNVGPCNGCGGMHFLLCFRCNGSKKLASGDSGTMKCPDCNENGLVKCSVCC